jgi:hypothetical protein
MNHGWPILSLLFSVLLPARALPDHDAQPPKVEKLAPKAVEVVLKGTLTSLEQEVTHTLPLNKDQTYTITLEARGFFAHVNIQDAHGRKLASATGSTTFKAPDDGTFRLLVTSPGGSTGQYVLSIRAIKLTPVKPGEVLSVGKEGLNLEAMLTKDDPIDKGRKKHCRIYDVHMAAGKTYVIDHMSKQFDAFLRLEDAAGKQLAQDDDSGGGTDARIRFKAPSEGVFRVIATTFDGRVGLFVLKIREE